MLHLLSHFTKSDSSQAQQGFLSPLIIPSPFPWLWFRWIVDRDSGNLVNPFMRATKVFLLSSVSSFILFYFVRLLRSFFLSSSCPSFFFFLRLLLMSSSSYSLHSSFFFFLFRLLFYDSSFIFFLLLSFVGKPMEA